MNSQETVTEAIQAMKTVAADIRADQWDQVMPPDFPMSDPSARKTVRDVINGIAYDMAWIPDMLTGRTMEEIGKDKYKGDLLGNDPRGHFDAIADTALAAIRDLPDLDRTVHCSYAAYPARNYFADIGGYYGLSAYDIPKAIGNDIVFPSTLVQGLWEQIEPVAEEWRAMGIFGPKVEVPANADLDARLLGLTGRQP